MGLIATKRVWRSQLQNLSKIKIPKCHVHEAGVELRRRWLFLGLQFAYLLYFYFFVIQTGKTGTWSYTLPSARSLLVPSPSLDLTLFPVRKVC